MHAKLLAQARATTETSASDLWLVLLPRRLTPFEFQRQTSIKSREKCGESFSFGTFIWRKVEGFLRRVCRTCSLLGVEFSHGSGALRGVRLQQIALSVTLSYQISGQGTLGTDSVWVLKQGEESVRSGLREDLQIIFVCQVLCLTAKVQDLRSWHPQKLQVWW